MTPLATRVVTGGQFLLPAIPLNTTPALVRLIDVYRARYVDDETAELWALAAGQVHDFEPLSLADLTAKLIIATHYRDPEHSGETLAIDASDAPVDRQGTEMQMRCIDWLMEMSARPDRTAWETVEAEYCQAWKLWDDLGDNFTNEESDAVAAVAFPAMERMMDTPAPDAAAMLMKMIAAREGGRIVNEDDMDALVADARRIAGAAPGPVDLRWAPRLSAYLTAKAAEDAYERDVYMLAYYECENGGARIADEIEAEIERLAGVRHDAENALMEVGAPDGSGLAIKFLVAHANGREANTYDPIIEADARRIAGWEKQS